MKFAFIRDNRKFFKTSVMCDVLDVTLAGFYAWLKRPDSKRAVRTKGLAEQIRVVHREVDHQSRRDCVGLRCSIPKACLWSFAPL